MKTLQQLSAALKQREAAVRAEYATVVRQIAANEPPDLAVIEATLAAAGKTLEDLQRDVEQFERRVAAAKQLEAARQAAEELKEVEAKRAENQAKRDAANAKFDAVDAPLSFRRSELETTIQQEHSVKQFLFNTMPDPLRSRYVEWQSRRNAAEAKRNELKRLASEARSRIDSLEARDARSVDGMYSGEIADARARLDNYLADLETAKSELATLDAEGKRLEAETLIP